MKAIKWIVKFLYRISGLAWVVSEVSIRVSAYRIRLNIVPVSYKLFLVLLGSVIGAASMFVYLESPEVLQSLESNTIVVENAKASSTPTQVAIKEEVPKITTLDELADLIHERESSKGKNNYSQCEKLGKFNEYGYAIPGNGSYLCFEKGMDRVAVLGWLSQRRAAGMSDKAMLCLYSGNNYSECK